MRPDQPSSIRRRSFLAGMTAAGAAMACGAKMGLSQAADPAAELQLGLVTYNWGKDMTVEELIKSCKAAGIAGVELRSTHKHGVEIGIDAAAREKVAKTFADSGVVLVGLGSACEYHSPDPTVLAKNIAETKEFIHLCHDLGASGVKVRPNGLPDGVPVEKTLQQIGKALKGLAEYASDYGVQLRLEVHGKGTSELRHVKTIMEVADHPGATICWNCNPQDLEGEGFEHNYKLVEKWMGTVHIHDLRKENYPWKELFAQLRKCNAPGFTGWTLIEEGGVPENLAEAMAENAKVWQRLAKG
jgi:sugar phosphate isomerase/epimerase